MYIIKQISQSRYHVETFSTYNIKNNVRYIQEKYMTIIIRISIFMSTILHRVSTRQKLNILKFTYICFFIYMINIKIRRLRLKFQNRNLVFISLVKYLGPEVLRKYYNNYILLHIIDIHSFCYPRCKNSRLLAFPVFHHVTKYP